ncbi:MAG: CYTH and CHAD domain-containing protein [Dactylosporangium sp.]|nr:CYTH and CHAD domain-containing protein [Dactylosporangium sp.]NNJ60387.1 CYTH and CHAD domain-containing protein [Dactylosporangium sp.]
MLEEDRRYQVAERFSLPDLVGCVPSGGTVVAHPPVASRATYHDTPDHRLARAGGSLRYGGDESSTGVWTADLPSDPPGTRHEICRPGPAKNPPADLVALLTAYHRGASLHRAVVLRTVRRAHEILDADGRSLVEIVDDTVRVFEGRRVVRRFREIEIRRGAGRPKLLNRIESLLRRHGAHPGDTVPNHVRAMGTAVPGAARLPDRPSAADVVAGVLRRDVLRILRNDPLVRMRQPVHGGDTPVHRMRVGCRRLRSDLRTFRPLLERAWADSLREDLRWLAEVLGPARDAEVLRARLHQTAVVDALAPLEPASLARIDADLTARHEEALLALDEMLAAPRYLDLLGGLVTASTAPELAEDAAVAARWALPPIMAGPWRRLVRGGAAALGRATPDADWHAVRVLGKRARYAADAAAAVLGGPAGELARALGSLQDLLGEHHDATIAAETWMAIAAADPDDHALAVTAGRLYERERATARRCRRRIGPLWQAVTRKRATAWLR